MTFVFDTNVFITGQRTHYPLKTFGSVWDSVEQWMIAGHVIVPRAVLVELKRHSDEVYEWLNERKEYVVEPSEAVQRQAGLIQQNHFSAATPRDQADPFVLAEAAVNDHVVVSYEGVDTYGAPTKKAAKKLPGICGNLGLECILLGQALVKLGGDF